MKDSRPFPDKVIRQRVCLKCGHRFYTEERITEQAKYRMNEWYSGSR